MTPTVALESQRVLVEPGPGSHSQTTLALFASPIPSKVGKDRRLTPRPHFVCVPSDPLSTRGRGTRPGGPVDLGSTVNDLGSLHPTAGAPDKIDTKGGGTVV